MKPRCAYCKQIVTEADRNSDGSYACDKCLRERMTRPYPRMGKGVMPMRSDDEYDSSLQPGEQSFRSGRK